MDVTVTLDCDNDCVFCPRTALGHVEVQGRAELERRLRAIRARSSAVTLSGGEVTVLPWALELVSFCRRLGFTEIALITNGRRLADASFAGRIVEAGLTEACVTIYDLRPGVHDAHTRTPGSLAQTLEGLENLLGIARRSPLSVRVNTMLDTLNADGLVRLVDELSSRGVSGFLVADVVLSERFSEPLPHERVVEIARAVASRARVPVVWRGFPLCLFRGLDVEAEPQDIDTTLVDRRSLDAYFAEFFSNFVHVPECVPCSERTRCPGVQKRYLDRLVPREISTLDLSTTPEAIQRDLEGFEPWPDPGRLAVTATTSCQARCTYCQVRLGRRHARPEVLDRSVDLLLTSTRPRVELQFFGGEPLVRKAEVVRTMERGRRLAGGRLHFTITTNGLLLDAETLDFLSGHDVHVLFSLDGPPDVMARFRPMPKRGIERILGNLASLVRSPVPHFVNVVITPDAAFDLPRRLRYLADLGVRTVQVCYALGPGWDAESRRTFTRALRECASLPLRIQNLGSHAEPVVLSNDLLVDVDGTLYSDAALFAEKAFPGLRRRYRIGSVFDIASMDGLRRTRERNLLDLRESYPPGSAPRRILEEHLEMGREVQRTLDDIGRPAARPRPRRDANPLLLAIKSPIADQVRLMERHPDVLRLPLLHLENPCAHDCIFCMSKPLDPTPFADAALWLAGNAGTRQRRLGLVGNEPLGHPDILRIVEEARSSGFERFAALTTGRPLSDPSRARALFDLGVRELSIPLWAADAASHDAITRSPGSHGDTMKAIENLRSLGAAIHIHSNLLRQNMDRMKDLESLVLDELHLPFCIIPVRPKDAHLPFSALAPSYEEIVGLGPFRSLVAFPLCVTARVQDPPVLAADLVSDVLKIYVLDQPFVKPPLCGPCATSKRCAGTFQEHIDLHGTALLKPFRRLRRRGHGRARGPRS